MKPTDEIREWAEKAASGSFEKIDSSEVFLSLLSENAKKDPLVCLQLGYAILNDKPIGVVAIEGSTVPKALRRIAGAVERADDLSGAEDAVRRVVEKLEEKRDEH